jgi:transcription-repair coupling factor (superfamily II helicase)
VFPPFPRPARGHRHRATALAASADALVIARWAREAGPLVVITAEPPDSTRLREEIAWFDPGLRVHQLPDWETLP